MTLRKFFIASLLVHLVFLAAMARMQFSRPSISVPSTIVTRLVGPPEVAPPPLPVPPRPAPLPAPEVHVPESSPPPETMEGKGTPGRDMEGRKKLEKKQLRLAEKKAIEKILEGEGKKGKREEDSGITFSTTEYRYYGYKMRLKEKIESIWKYPPEAARKGIYADLYIRFTILKNGELGSVELLRTSGYKMLDDAAMQALRDAAPFWPLPEEWGEDSFTITGHFVYTLYGYYLR